MDMTEEREDTAASGEEADRPSSAKSKDKDKDRKVRNKTLTKIVLRRLPPSMTEESFLEQVSPIPEHDYFYFARPDPSLGSCGFSRAYINFVNLEDIYLFKDKFDGYIFLDEKGLEYVGIVEYAPFQRVPKKRRKKDSNCGTIESDPDYEKFLESLKEPEAENREPKLEFSYPLNDNNDKKASSTPLLEYLATRKLDKRNREERRRREADKKKVRVDRKTKEATIQEEEVSEAEVKKIKSREWEKEKTSPKNKEEEIKSSESKDAKVTVKISKTYREQRKPVEEKKRAEGDKKEFKKEYDDKIFKKDKREKDRSLPKEQKTKEVKKYSEVRKDRFKIDKNEEEVEKTEKRKPLRDSDIKPFTQLPPVKTDDLTKVIEEMDRLMKEEVSRSEKLSESNSHTELSKSEKVSSRRKSFDLSVNNVDNGKRQNNSDDRSKSSERENSVEKDKSSGAGDPRTERRIRNKDRPSMVIYQPGMGKFSKQRLGKEKENQNATEVETQDKDT